VTVDLVAYLWDFGDGSTSTEPSPEHVYTAPGIYYPSLVAQDKFGNTYTVPPSIPIYVYDYTYGNDGLRSGFTDACFRLAIKKSQGCGIVPYSGKWVWPMVLTSTVKGINAAHEAVSLVINSSDMGIYRIGVPEVWVDREGSYEETEIPTEAMLPEITSRSGEHENVRHIETHIGMRSWDELRYKGAVGYTADGQRVAQVLSIEAFKSGEQILPTTKIQKVNLEGDYALLKEVEARRIQLKIKTATSSFRITRVGVHCQEIDHRTPPQINVIPEKVWQKEFSSPDVWFSLNKPAIQINRGDGLTWSGMANPVTDPTGKNKAFLASAGLDGVTGYAIADFTLSAWVNGDAKIFQAAIPGTGIFIFQTTLGILMFSDGVNTVQIMLQSTGWVYVAAIRRGNDIELYENGLLRTVQVATIVPAIGGPATVGAGMCYDVRRNLKAISSDAINYYYQSILNGSGGFLP
jgi:PKD repeat protein